MLDTNSLRDEAFQHLHQMPHFCSNVILLIEELEKSRETISVKDNILDDDAKIIHGLVEHYRTLESLAIIARKFAEGMVSREVFDGAWREFENLIIVRP